jgi:two-component system sensor histidine kinase YesM
MRDRLRSMMGRWGFWLEKRTLQQRLVLAYIVILLLPSVWISTVLFREFSVSAIRNLEKTNENALEIEQIHIHNNIETMKRAAQLAITDRDVLDYVSRTTEPSTQELIALNDGALQTILRSQYNNPSIEHIRIYTAYRWLYEIWPVFLSEKRIRGESWYGSVLASNGADRWEFSREDAEVVRSTPGEGGGENKPKVSLLQEIQYPQGNHAAIVQVDMLLANFFPNTFSQLQDEHSQMLVIDRNGDVYRHPGNPLLQSAGMTESYLREQFEAHRDAGAETGSFRFKRGRLPFLCVYSRIPQLDAYMLSVVSLESVYSEVNRTRNRIMLANLILLVLLTISTYLLNSLILKKLHVLTDSMKKVRQGDFNFDLAIRGGGEVGELAHHFRKMLQKINELIADAVRKQAASKEAELATLKNQIDSHFLYNTLENIKMMAEMEGQAAISDALTSLGGMMRYNMKWTSEYVRLRDELLHIANYVNIVNIRFDGRVRLRTDVPEAHLNQELLKMSLQPVVENAVKHGLREREMTIAIRTMVAEDTMRIEIADDGAGMTPEQLERLNLRMAGDEPPPAPGAGGAAGARTGSGIGLANVHRRIRMHYGEDYGLHVESGPDAGTRVVIRIPHYLRSGGLN